MENKTSVEWLYEQLKLNLKKIILKGDSELSEGLLNKAKERHKEEIIKAVYDSMGTNFDPNMGKAEQYYNEIYGKGDNK